MDNGYLGSETSDESVVFSTLVSNFRLDKYQPLSEVYRYLTEVATKDERSKLVSNQL